MINFALGLTTGFCVGAVACFAGGIIVAVVVEDSPEILKTIAETYQKIT